MKIMDNSIVRDMTEEEEEAFIAMHENQPEYPEEYATVNDYENALSDLGVKFGD